jgi:AcrR family transcriptional regulator
MAVAGTDRRQQRRQDTIREILDAALEVMAEEGVAGLSLAEVARRVGMRPPSLYQYFPSKLAVYDALFAEGMQACLDHCEAQTAGPPVERLKARQRAFVRWGVANPVLFQLLFWRPVPGFEPSPAAMAPSIALLEGFRADLEAAVGAGDLRPEAATDEALALGTALSQGVITQHLANEPDVPFGQGRFTALVDLSVELFLSHYANPEGSS